MQISLAIISRYQDLEGAYKAIASVEKYVDEVCLTIADSKENLENPVAVPTIKDFKETNYKVSRFEWRDDFSAAREFNFKQCTGDWIIWLDSDDVLLGADKLKPLIELGEQNNISGFAFKYKYNFDENGNCIDEHWKMQLLKNDGHFQWAGAIHEDPIQMKKVNWSKTEDCVRVHSITEEKTKESYERNLRILEKEYIKNPKEPRTLFYLGRTYYASKQFQKAIDSLVEYLELSGWDEERYEATLLVAQCFKMTGQLDEAVDWYNKAVLEKEEYPDAYIYKGMCYLAKEEYKKAVSNFENAITKDKPDANTYFNPMFYSRDLVAAMAICYLHLGKFDKALSYAKHGLSVDPKNKDVKYVYDVVLEIKDKVGLAKEYSDLIKHLEKRKQNESIKIALYSVPKELSDNPFITTMKMKYLNPGKWSPKSIVIFCGNSPEVWTPNSIDGGGIGGSETAVIELSKRLHKMGWEVTVYANCNAKPEGDIYEGVRYKNYWDFNYFDEYNILWIWRLPEMLDYDLKAKAILLDLHDIINPLDFNAERLEKITKIMVKSKYHRGLLPKVPDDKFEIIGNGINLERFEEQPKDPYKFIYSSTPNRGLDILLESKIWERIKEKYPQATLHTFYGWNTFYQLEKHNPERMAYMKKMQKLMEQTGVVNHGRVGQKELAKEMATASYWLYPTYFPEIHCCVGNTLIEMPRNHKEYPNGIPIKELVGKSNFPVYSYDNESDKIVLGTARWVKKTRKNAEIWRLNLDNNTYLEATSDHLIMLRNGEYKPLKELKAGDSLMPVYMRANFMIKQNNGRWVDEHRMVGEWKANRKLKTNEHVDHIDDSRYDNRPEMLEIMEASEHHRKTFSGRERSKRSIEAASRGWKVWSKSENGKEVLSKHGIDRANKFWKSVFPSWTKTQQKEFLQKRVNTRMYNHKVVSVENTGRKEDVYDMEVEKYHNFGANGVIIHNCITACEMQAAGVVPITSGYAALEETQKVGVKLEGDVYDREWQERYLQEVFNLLENQEKTKQLSQEAKSVAPEFSWDLVADKWNNLCQELKKQ